MDISMDIHIHGKPGSDRRSDAIYHSYYSALHRRAVKIEPCVGLFVSSNNVQDIRLRGDRIS